MNKKTIFFLTLLFALFACEKKEENKELVNIYEGCCGNTPVVYNVGDGIVYIANMYTPNQDGWNEMFIPYCNSGIQKITDLKIWNREDVLIWEKDSIRLGIPSSGWHPKTLSNETYTGMFKYSMIAYDTNDVSFNIIGEACSFNCDTLMTVIENPNDCCFPNQANIDGIYVDTAWTPGLNCE